MDEWSNSHLCAKNLLSPEDWTIAKLELHAANTLANMAAVLKHALGDWVEVMIYCLDSEIALSWIMYEKSKLNVFHRLRVANIRSKIDLNCLYHVDGKENVTLQQSMLHALPQHSVC